MLIYFIFILFIFIYLKNNILIGGLNNYLEQQEYNNQNNNEYNDEYNDEYNNQNTYNVSNLSTNFGNITKKSNIYIKSNLNI
tara:strand:- start:77 stop:322 length:246 start_codon:yes stop_codon:yes gene_type:complete